MVQKSCEICHRLWKAEAQIIAINRLEGIAIFQHSRKSGQLRNFLPRLLKMPDFSPLPIIWWMHFDFIGRQRKKWDVEAWILLAYVVTAHVSIGYIQLVFLICIVYFVIYLFSLTCLLLLFDYYFNPFPLNLIPAGQRRWVEIFPAFMRNLSLSLSISFINY